MFFDLLILISLAIFSIIYFVVFGWHLLLVNGKTKRKEGNVGILLVSVFIPLVVVLGYHGAPFVHVFAVLEAAAITISCLGFMIYTLFRRDIKVGLR